MQEGRDVWWHEAMEAASPSARPTRSMPSTAVHPYSSGSTNKPKGILHTTGGYLTGVAWTTARLRPQARDRRLLVRGRRRLDHRPLLHRLRPAAQRRHAGHVRGPAGLPGQGRHWELFEPRRHDLLLRADRDPVVHEVGRRAAGKHDLSSLRLLGTVGEPINPKAWLWYREVIGGERARSSTPGGRPRPAQIMITTLPGAQYMKPGSAGDAAARHRGDDPRRVHRGGVGADKQGLLVLTKPWPGMLRTLYKRQRALRRDLLPALRAGGLPRRRRRAQGRRRLPLDHRPHRRRDQRLGPSDVDGGDRVGDRVPRMSPRPRSSGRATRTPASRLPRS